MPGEVPFNRDIGSTVTRNLFDIIGEASEGVLTLEIERAILYCEPRVTFDPFDPGQATQIDYQSAAGDYTGRVFQGDDLGVTVFANPNQNQIDVRVVYRIIGSEKIYYVQEILTPTR